MICNDTCYNRKKYGSLSGDWGGKDTRHMAEVMNGKRAAVAMSGGVDSSVTAFLMREAGYETSGAIMRLYERPGSVNQGVSDAQKVADKLGIGLFIFDMREEFRTRILEYFVREYENGRTPNPCVVCNRYLKFEALYDTFLERMSQLSPDDGRDVVMATGHYAVTGKDTGSGRYTLRKASDPAKDQSYFLYALTQEQLSRTVFPLGSKTKEEVRELAEQNGLVNARKKDSQDICFVPDGDYVSFITGFTGREYAHGSFTDASGKVLGEHKGIINYTVGQRKGLGIALGKPAYVCGIDPAKNQVILGDNEDLFTRELEVADFNWVSAAMPKSDMRALARIRYRHKESPAVVIPLAEDRVKIIFDEPQRAITRGQSAVLYDGDYVLGGGIIV